MRLIDADALTEKYGDWYTEEGTEEGYIGTIKGIVESMPTIEERKKGKWVIQDNPETGWYRVECSECDEDVTSNIPMIGFFPHCKPLWDFCPYCGADMRGEEHE